MRIHVLSDLHFEFGGWPADCDVNAVDADLTILAGDIGVGLRGLQWATTFNRPVIYVMGNHEFYGQRPMNDLWIKARDLVAGSNVHLLENQSVLIDDPRTKRRIRFLGASLWTDFCLLGADRQDENMRLIPTLTNDFTDIFYARDGIAPELRKSAKLTPRRTLAWHHESRDFLEQELGRKPDLMWMKMSDVWDTTVVVTHHAPSIDSLSLSGEPTVLDSAYASRLESLVEQADLWVHGHTHVQLDYPIGAGRVVSNPRGYVGEGLVSGFNPTFAVEV